MIKPIYRAIAVLALMPLTALAETLPAVENVRIEGSQLLWDEQEGATGYNIYVNYNYYDTVKNALQYSVSDEGKYLVVAFDDAGNFSPAYGTYVEFSQEGQASSSSSSYTVNNYTITVQKTCLDVGPGESCVAACPNEYAATYSTRYTQYLSGGACSTSDIVEADAFASDMTYKCTVPTFSGEVVAQAICVTGSY